MCIFDQACFLYLFHLVDLKKQNKIMSERISFSLNFVLWRKSTKYSMRKRNKKKWLTPCFRFGVALCTKQSSLCPGGTLDLWILLDERYIVFFPRSFPPWPAYFEFSAGFTPSIYLSSLGSYVVSLVEENARFWYNIGDAILYPKLRGH